MDKEQKLTFKQVMFIVTICLMGLISCSAFILVTVTSNLYDAYPNDTAYVNFITSGSTIVLLIASLLTPALLKIFGNKAVCVASCLMCLVPGVLFGYVTNIKVLAVLRCFDAFSRGAIGIAAVSAVTDFMEDEAQRTKVLGWYSAACAFVATIMASFAGILGKNQWTGAFRAYWCTLPLLILIILFVPAAFKKDTGDTETKKKSFDIHDYFGFGRRFWAFNVYYAIYSISHSIVSSFYSLYVAEHALGDSAINGYISSAGSILGILPGLVLAWLVKRVKKWLPAYTYGLMVLGFIAMYFFPSLPSVFFGVICAWLSVKTNYAYSMIMIPAILPEGKKMEGFSVFSVFCNLATFVPAYFITFTMGVMKTDSYTKILIVPMVILIVAMILEAISCRNDQIGEEG